MPNSTIHVAVGVVFNAEGKILVALRPAEKLQGGLWEFPGGKIEANETPEAALRRELLEEVGIHVNTAEPLIECDHHYQNHHVHLIVFQVHQFTGTAHGKEGQTVEWVTIKQLLQRPLLSANHPIVEAIQAFMKQ